MLLVFTKVFIKLREVLAKRFAVRREVKVNAKLKTSTLEELRT